MNSVDNSKQVASELLPYLRVYTDGSIDRLTEAPRVPTSPDDPETGVSSKDITISESPKIGARIYLPKNTQPNQKLPVLVYFHGGGLCFESAYSLTETTLTNRLSSEANLLAVSIEYRLAPENPIPIPHEDCWTALKLVTSQLDEPWIKDHADLGRLFIGGDSAGGNLAHYVLMRAGSESLPNGVKIRGAFLTHPYFWGSEPVGNEVKDVKEREKLDPYRVWKYLTREGIDHVIVNPIGEGKPSLSGLGCERLLVSVAELDVLRDRGVWYVNAVKESGYRGEVELVDVEGETHAFHILKYETENAKWMIKRLASFILK